MDVYNTRIDNTYRLTCKTTMQFIRQDNQIRTDRQLISA